MYYKHQNPGNDSVLSGSSISVGRDNVISGSSIESNNIIRIREHCIDGDCLYFSPVNKRIDVNKIIDRAKVISDTYGYYYCDIIWDSADDIDTSSPCKTTLTGTVVPPDGFEFNKEANVKKTILIYDENNPTEYMKPIEYNFRTYLVGLDKDLSNYLQKDMLISTTTDDLFKADIQWLDTISPNTRHTHESFYFSFLWYRQNFFKAPLSPRNIFLYLKKCSNVFFLMTFSFCQLVIVSILISTIYL